jgi:hypothetical protein
MKVLRAAAMLAFLLAGPVFAQSIKPPAPSEPPTSPSEREFQQSTDKAYRNSLGNIPDKPPADPWGGAHAVDPPKSAAPAPAKRTKTSTGNTTN